MCICACMVCVCVYMLCFKQSCKPSRASKDRGRAREHKFRKFTNCLKSHRINASHHTMVHTTHNWSESQASGPNNPPKRCLVLEFSFPLPSLFLRPDMFFFKAARLQTKGDIGHQNRFHFKLIPADRSLGLDTTTLIFYNPVSVRN